MGGRKLVYVRIVVAAVFVLCYLLLALLPSLFWSFNMALFASKNSRAPEEYACTAGYITLCLNDFFVCLFGWRGGGGRYIQIMIVRS